MSVFPTDKQSQANFIAGTLAMGLMVLLGIALYALFTTTIPPPNHDVLLVVIGMLTASISTVINFFFGSSSANRQKDATLDTMANAAASTVFAASPNPQPLKDGDKVEVTTTGATLTKDGSQ